MSQRLPILVNTETNERLTLRSSVTIGRAPENQIVLADDGYVSGDHARIFWENGWLIEDLGSSNGTYVNSEMISAKRILAPGDLITIGRTTFKIE